MASKQGLLKHEPKLTWAQVNAVRRDYRWHSRQAGGAALAKKYGVSANTIHKIIHGKVWRVRSGDGNVPLPRLNRPNWKALLQVEERTGNLFDAIERLLR